MSKNKPTRSNFDLICGMILGGLIVGTILPITMKNFGGESSKKSLRARAPISHHMKSITLDKAKQAPKGKIVASANVEPARISDKLTPTKTSVDAKPIEKIEKDLKTTQSETPKPVVKKVETKKQTPKKIEKPKSAAKIEAPQRQNAALEEMSGSASAQAVAAKTDSALTATGIPAESSDSVITITNAQYSKEQLQNCSKRCLLKSTDQSGKVIHAIIHGPAFAEVLESHQGTINIIGVKRVVKNYEVFMVQNITFNLPSKTQTAKAMQTKDSTPASEPKWEDLSDDLKIR